MKKPGMINPRFNPRFNPTANPTSFLSGRSGTGESFLAGMGASFLTWIGCCRFCQNVTTTAIEVLRLYDSPSTLFYCDPPYLHATRGDSKAYGFEMDVNQHREFASVANRCTGKVAVSGYDHPLMEELFPPDRWIKTPGADKTIHSTKGSRQEVLWTNFAYACERPSLR